MATSEIMIANYALGHLGIGNQIVAFTEQSKPAQACLQFYAQTRDEVLREFPWPFATVTVAPALVATDPTTEWGYSYRYPSDAISLQGFLTGGPRNSPVQVVHAISEDATGLVIYTDQPDAVIQYTKRVTNPVFFPPDFTQAVAYLLASYIAPQVAGGDQFKLGATAFQKYQYQVSKAAAASTREELPDRAPDGELVRAREFGIDVDTSYPISSL